MRFGRHSHDIDLEKFDATGERDRLVRTLRDVADRIEKAPRDRITESPAWIAAALEPLMGILERARGRQK